ncbi:RDD family protein [Hydrocarboniphaga sp.]|uniref:RDD family protein n=1 Tax=Hydrocarboniphaga sp. TaxID=2033016 RepID=UPI003D135AE9
MSEIPTAPIAPLWRRVAAFLMDAVLLALTGFLIGALFYDALAQMGFRARLVGVGVSLLYFGLLDSRIGGGRTLGKRLFGLRVVGRDGETVGVPRAALRYGVLAIAWFLNGAPVDSDAFAGESPGQFAIAVLGAVAVFGLALSLLYLLLFNHRTRQSLHDLVSGCYVVYDGGGVPAATGLWRGHVVVVVLLLLASMAIPLGMKQMSRTPAFVAMMQVQRAVAQEPGVSEVSIQIGTAARTAPDTKTEPQHSLSILARSVIHDEPQQLAQRLANRALDALPEVATLDLIGVHTYYGYDIGIARKITAYSLMQTPLQWRQRIDTDTPEPDTDVEVSAPPTEPAKAP